MVIDVDDSVVVVVCWIIGGGSDCVVFDIVFDVTLDGVLTTVVVVDVCCVVVVR